MVRIKYWQQETIESGRFILTGLMPLKTAKKLVNEFERGTIVSDSEFEWKEEQKRLKCTESQSQKTQPAGRWIT